MAINNNETKQRIIMGVIEGTNTPIEVAVDATGHIQVDVDQSTPSAGVFGVSAATVGGVAQTVVAVSTPLRRSVMILADVTNTETIYIGFAAGVTAATGFPLPIGIATRVWIDDVQKIFMIDSGGGGQTARYIGS